MTEDNVHQLTTPLVEQAVKLGEAGLYVHPLVGKRPVLQEWQNRASCEEADIRAMFDEVPNATNIGVVAGKSDLFVIDLDVDKTTGEKIGYQWYQENGGALPHTRVHETPSGGHHLLFDMPDEPLPNISIAEKVDSRGVGGYIVWPTENSGYKVFKDRPIAKLPASFVLSLRQRASEISKISMDEIHSGIITDASGFALHDLVNQMIYRLAKDGKDVGTIVSLTREVMNLSEAKTKRPSDWQDRYDDIPRSVHGAVRRIQKNEARGDDVDKALRAALEAADYELPSGTYEVEIAAPEPSSAAFSGKYRRSQYQNADYEPFPATQWVVTGFLERGAVTGIAGWTNVGKTRMVVSSAVSVASGEDVIGFEIVEPGGVVIVTHEEKQIKMDKRIHATMQRHEIAALEHPISILSSENSTDAVLVKLNDKREPVIVQSVVDDIVREAEEIGASLVILDPLVALSVGLSENDAGMNKLMLAMRQIASRADVAVLFIHHTPKGGRNDPDDWYLGSLEAFRGSGAIAGALDIGFTLSRIGTMYNDMQVLGAGAEAKQWLRLEQSKGRETLLDTSAVYFLYSQDIDVRDRDGNIIKEPNGVIDVMTYQDLRDLENKIAEDVLRDEKLKKDMGYALDKIFSENDIQHCWLGEVHKIVTKRDSKMSGRQRDAYKAALPIEHGEWVYDLKQIGRKEKIVREAIPQ